MIDLKAEAASLWNPNVSLKTNLSIFSLVDSVLHTLLAFSFPSMTDKQDFQLQTN